MIQSNSEISILLIDDEVNVLNALTRCLRNEGYHLHTAVCYSEAMALIAKTDLALVICDYNLPDMSGSELLASIERRNPKCIRILLTGASVADAVPQQIMDSILHCQLFVPKPWDDNELRKLIRNALAGNQTPTTNPAETGKSPA